MADQMMDEKLLDCDQCIREIPTSEDVSDEARDYIMHYCGIECYETWQKSDKPSN